MQCQGGQKQVLDLLGMELQKDLSDHTYIWVEWESNPRSSCWATFTCPWGHYLWPKLFIILNPTKPLLSIASKKGAKFSVWGHTSSWTYRWHQKLLEYLVSSSFLATGMLNSLYYSHEDSLVSPGALTQGLCLCIKSLLPRTFLWTQPVWKLAV